MSKPSVRTGPVVESTVKVRYAETDAQRVVYHGNYIVWFEVGRTDYCERAGYPYPRMEAEGIFITVVEAAVRYRKAARYGDTVTVRTWFGGLRSRSCTFLYEVRLLDGSLSAEGETHHLFLDAAGRPVSAPPRIRDTFLAFSTVAGATVPGTPSSVDGAPPASPASPAPRDSSS